MSNKNENILNKTLTLEMLPDDCLLEIIQHISVERIMELKTTNKFFNKKIKKFIKETKSPLSKKTVILVECKKITNEHLKFSKVKVNGRPDNVSKMLDIITKENHKYLEIEFFNWTINCELLFKLKNVKKLLFSYCFGINNVSMFSNVTRLHVNCGDFSDVSSLGNLEHLTLCNISNLENVSALGNVHTLYIENCKKVTDITALTNNKILRIVDCGAKFVFINKYENIYCID